MIPATIQLNRETQKIIYTLPEDITDEFNARTPKEIQYAAQEIARDLALNNYRTGVDIYDGKELAFHNGQFMTPKKPALDLLLLMLKLAHEQQKHN